MPLFGHRRDASPTASDVAPGPNTTNGNMTPTNGTYNNGNGNGVARSGTGRFFGNRNNNNNNNNVDGYGNGNGMNGNGMNGNNAYENEEAAPRRSGSGGSFFSRGSRNSSNDGMNGNGVTSTSLPDAHAMLDAAVVSERAADAALRDARLAVRDARNMVDRIEREARREADAAAAKLKEARTMRKTAGGLGKFGTA